MILKKENSENFCEKCVKKYTNISHKWCKECQINHLKENFTNWTSGNKRIDNLIQEMQLKIDYYNDIIFEWIPYNQFDEIEEIFKGFVTAKWKDGPLHWNNEKYTRNSADKAVTLKYINNSQDITNESLNKV